MAADTANHAHAEPRPFDFRHPSTLSRDDARVLQVLQETFAHGVATTLASAVRANIDVQIGRIDQTPHGEALRNMANPSSLTLLRLDPIAPTALLQIDPTITFSVLELLLGGPGTGPHPERAHTEVEESILVGLLARFLPSVDEAFEPIHHVVTSLTGQESNPSFVQIASNTDMVVSINLDVGVDEVRGGMRLIVPVAALRPWLDALVTEPVDTQRSPDEGQIVHALVTDHLSSVDVTATARFEPLIASSKQLMELAVGDVLALEHQADQPLTLEIDGVAIHEVAIGRVRRNFAVEVVGAAPAPRRLTNRLTNVSRG